MRRGWPLLLWTVLVACEAGRAQAGPAEQPARSSDRLARILAGGVPRDAEDLRAMEEHTQALLAKVLPAIVSIGGASGVIVEGRYVLSAGHVTRRPGRSLTVILHDGRRIRGRTLGANLRTDAGLLEVDGGGKLPSLEMGRSEALAPGQWCLMLGHPGGRKHGLSPPLRLGRIQRTSRGFLVSDCTMSAGDSGGPLLDMEGRVIGINSRISRSLDANMHVPIDAFRRDWDRLVGEEVIGAERTETAFLGVRHDPEADEALIQDVVPDSAAARAGLRPGDVIVRFGRRRVRNGGQLAWMIQRFEPGAVVTVEIRRGDRTIELRAKLGARGDR